MGLQATRLFVRNCPPMIVDVNSHRQSKRELICAFFEQHLDVKFSSAALHGRFGSSFRTRVSELNRDPNCAITIKNQVHFIDGSEQSVYWAEPRTTVSETLALVFLEERHVR